MPKHKHHLGTVTMEPNHDLSQWTIHGEFRMAEAVMHRGKPILRRNDLMAEWSSGHRFPTYEAAVEAIRLLVRYFQATGRLPNLSRDWRAPA